MLSLIRVEREGTTTLIQPYGIVVAYWVGGIL
jgi:hypothetical protein